MSNQAQRVKGNAKPSNSDRAARLLNTNNAFLSFSAASQTLSNVYAGAASTDGDSSSFKYGLSSDFQVIFKHMAKKDINTKLKALQDFTEVCATKSTDELLQTAPFWYRVYRKLSNDIDWRVRQEVNGAHFQFITRFDRNTIANDIQNVSAAYSEAETADPTTDVSFQSLITMPAIMWTASFDVYTQAADSAKKALTFLLPSEKDRIDFLLANYELIINYCTYCVFDKIPVKLFYTKATLDADSLKVFEEHLLVTCLRGLSSLVNELICFYIDAECKGTDDQRQKQIFQCLEQIFSRLNTEISKNKLASVNKAVKSEEVVTNSGENDTNEKAFLSKKDIKRQQKKDKENANKETSKGPKGHCKFWSYFGSDNISIRISCFHALNSVTRLTSLMYDSQPLKDGSIFEQLNTANHLWFKLYKTNFFENLFKSFVDSVAEVRGLAWLLGTHVLNYSAIYKPWSVVNHDKWLKETLVAFISNGMRTAGGTIDFGLFNIGLEKCKLLYPEFFSKKYSHLSGLQLTSSSYVEQDTLVNVKLIVVFVDAFNRQEENQYSLSIFKTVLFALNSAIARVYLQSDMDFLIEIYFNLIYHLVRQCLQLPLKSKVQQLPESSPGLVEEMKLPALFIELFQTHLLNIVEHSLNSATSEMLCNSQIYLNLLLLVNNTAECYKDLSGGENSQLYDLKTLTAVYDLFKANMHKLYSKLFKLADAELEQRIAGQKSTTTDFALNRVLRFLNDSTLFQLDGYFSSEFYYSKGNTNYDKNALKALHSTSAAESSVAVTASGNPTKRVNFFSDDDANGKEAVSIHKRVNSAAANWRDTQLGQSAFFFSLGNCSSSSSSSQRQRPSISFLAEYAGLLEEVIYPIAVKLIKLADSQLNGRGQLNCDESFLTLLHLQYFLRTFNSQQLLQIFALLEMQPKVSEELPVKTFIKSYPSRWISSIYASLSGSDHQLPLAALRFQVMLCRKVYDIILVCLSKQESNGKPEDMSENLFIVDGPFAFCVFSHHIKQLMKLPLSAHYTSIIAQYHTVLSDFCKFPLAKVPFSQSVDAFFTQPQTNKSLECDILVTLFLFALHQFELNPEQTLEQKELFMEQLGANLDALQCQLFETKASSRPALQFLLELPLLCREVYRVLFDNVHLLNKVEHFEGTFVNFTKGFFSLMLHSTAACLPENELTVRAFVDNSITFWKFAVEQLFALLPKYEASLKSLVRDLLNIAVNTLVFEEQWSSFNYQMIISQISTLLETVIEQYKPLVLDSVEASEVAEVLQQFDQFQANFHQKIAQKVRHFLEDNIVAALFELERENSTSLQKLFAVHEIFQNGENVQTLEKVNNANHFNELLGKKLVAFEQSLYLCNFQASVVHKLLLQVYLDPVFRKQHHFNLSLALNSQSSTPFDLLPTVRSLLVNLYHLDRYLMFYFYQKAEAPKFEELRSIYSSLRREIEAILRTLKGQIKKGNEGNQQVLQLASFLIFNKDQNCEDISSLPFANYVVTCFFPALNWMELLNHIGLPIKFTPSAISKATILAIARTENIAKVNEVLSQALRHFTGAAVSESYSEEKVSVSKLGVAATEEDLKGLDAPLFDWSKLPTEEINQMLFVVNVAFYKLANRKATAEETAVSQLKEQLRNFLTLLSWSRLEKLFEPNIPLVNSPKYLTFLLVNQMITEAVSCLEEEEEDSSNTTRPQHYSMFLSVLKLWVQILYTSLPEAVEKEEAQELRVLLMSSQMLATLNYFGQQSKTISMSSSPSSSSPAATAEESQPSEMNELWRNFVAFDSYNMLLPLFIVLNDGPKRNLIEKSALKRLVQTTDYIDTECLRDISTLELNQYLLMYPDDQKSTQSSQRTLQVHLDQFIENAHISERAGSSSSRRTAKQEENTALLSLSPSNKYHEYLLNYATPLLLHSDVSWSTSAFQVLSIMFQDLPWNEKNLSAKQMARGEDDDMLSLSTLNTSLLNEKEIQLAPPECFQELLEKLDKVTEYILMDCNFGESVMIDPKSDVYNYIFAYLLVWLLYLHLVDSFPMGESQESRVDLIAYVADRGLHFRLFDNLFHLMDNLDEEELSGEGAEDDEKSGCGGSSENIADYLRKLKDLKENQNLRHLMGDRGGANSLPKLALTVYYHMLRNLPHLIRSWFGSLKPTHKQLVDGFTIRHCSTVLIEKELDALQTVDREKFGNIVVRASKKVNEITAVYSLKEISFGIKFSFNENFPLTTVKVECFNRSGVSEDRCRKWIQRLTIFFNKLNCSIMNGIILLRPNMDKFFEGIEECMICLFVLFGASSAFPRFKCPQCRKKFHYACIRKWFQTNNNRVCPQCKFEFVS